MKFAATRASALRLMMDIQHKWRRAIIWFNLPFGGLSYSRICECYPTNENLVWCSVSSRCLRCS